MLTVYGFGASQPSRAVLWTCLIKELRFEFCDVRLDQPGSDGPLASMNPTGQVPIINDGGFSLYEMPAILAYLCRKHGWIDLYPEDVEACARIDQYMHFHQNRTRNITHKLMAPHIAVAYPEELLGGRDLGGLMDGTTLLESAKHPDKLKIGHEASARIFQFIEKDYFQGTTFLCTENLSIADIACYEEVGQLVFANLFDFEDFPKLRGWLEAMSKVPHHDTAHCYNTTLGDIATQPNTLERMLPAIAAATEAISAAGVDVTTLD